jgi:hypothetical protein
MDSLEQGFLTWGQILNLPKKSWSDLWTSWSQPKADKYYLDHDVRTMLKFIIQRQNEVHAEAEGQPPRFFHLKGEDRKAYYPPSGDISYATEDGRELAQLPNFTKGQGSTDADRCHKYGQFNRQAGQRQSTHGLFIFICRRSGKVIGFHTMVNPEGCRDLLSLYRHHPGGLRELLFDFSCGAVPFLNNRVPHW